MHNYSLYTTKHVMMLWVSVCVTVDNDKFLKRLKVCKLYVALHENPSQSSLAIWDHTMLSATRHKWTHPALTSARQAGTRFTYPVEWKAKLTQVVGYIPRWFTCLQTVTHPSSNRAWRRATSLIETNALTTPPPSLQIRVSDFDPLGLGHGS